MKHVIVTTITTTIAALGLVGSSFAQQFDLGGFPGGHGGQQFTQQLSQQVTGQIQHQLQPYSGQFGQRFGQQLQSQVVKNAGRFVDGFGQDVVNGGIINGQGRQIIEQVQRYLPPEIHPPKVEPPVIEPPIIEPPCTANPPACSGPPQPIAPAWQARPWNQPSYPPQTNYPQQTLQFQTQPESGPQSKPQPETPSATQTRGQTPVDELKEVESGSIVNVEGEYSGEQPGGVYLKINEMLMETVLVGWSDSVAKAKLPNLPIVGESRAVLVVLTAEATIGQTMEVRLVPATAKEESAEEIAVDESEEEVEVEDDAAADEATEIISAGEQLSLEGEFGTTEGTVALRVASMNFQSRIIKWTESSVEFEVPALATTEAQPAELVIRDSDNQVVDTYEVSYAAGHK